MTAGKLANDLISSHKTKMGMTISAASHIIPSKVPPSQSFEPDNSVDTSTSTDSSVSFDNVLSSVNQTLFPSHFDDNSPFSNYPRYPSFDAPLHPNIPPFSHQMNSYSYTNSFISDNANGPQNTTHTFSIASLVTPSQSHSPTIKVPVSSPSLPINAVSYVPLLDRENSPTAPNLSATSVVPDILPPTNCYQFARSQIGNILTDITNATLSSAINATTNNVNGGAVTQVNLNNTDDDNESDNQLLDNTDDSNEESPVENVIPPRNMLKGYYSIINLVLTLLYYYKCN